MQETEIVQRLAIVEEGRQSNTKRIDELEEEMKDNRELTVAVKEIATEIKHLREEQTDMNKRLKEIEDKPAQKWDKVTMTIIATVVGGIIGALISQILK